MIRSGCAVDQNVVKEDQVKPQNGRSKNRLHECLKCRMGVREAKGHYEKFIIPFMHSESAFLNIERVYPYLVITKSEIELQEHLSAGELVHEFFHCGNWEAIFHRNQIQGSVVYTKPPQAIFLLN